MHGGARRGLTLPVVLLALITAGCFPVGPTWPDGGGPGDPVEPGSVLVGCDRAAERIVVTVSSHLDPSCTYTGGLEATASGVVLDCRGALVSDPTGEGRRGILVTAAADADLSDITVRNCVVEGFMNSVRIRREGFKDLPPGGEYEHGYSNVVIEESRFRNSRGSGVFVDGFVTDVTLRNLDISGAGSVGIYLEAGSRGGTVTGNYIHGNGFGDVVPEGIPFVINGIEFRYASTGREGIAVDGSRDNQIFLNRIEGNAAGGIFLYKNCGEYATQQPGGWWQRLYGAEGNLIRANVIVGERNGVWIGSRQSQNQYFMDCSDPAYVDEFLRRIHHDPATGNTVDYNVFVGDEYAIRVEDDANLIDANWVFSNDATHRAVVIGTKERTAILGEPVTGTTVTRNHADIAGNPTPYTWAWGHEATTFADNTTPAGPASLVEGDPPPINPFLFVIEFWLP